MRGFAGAERRICSNLWKLRQWQVNFIAYVDNIIEVLGLKEKLKSFPNQLSGGRQQRVAIARAMIMKPEVILADEPTGNLDSRNGNEVLKLFWKSIKDMGQTLIMIAHNDN